VHPPAPRCPSTRLRNPILAGPIALAHGADPPRLGHALGNDFVGAIPTYGAHSLSVGPAMKKESAGRPGRYFDRYDFEPVVDGSA
jgi:hypothetical protein